MRWADVLKAPGGLATLGHWNLNTWKTTAISLQRLKSGSCESDFLVL